MAYLKVTRGPGLGQVREVTPPKTVLGRYADCDVVLDSLDVSRHHAQILYVDDNCCLEDLHSRNGTFLNDQRVRGRLRINDGDHIRLGDTTFKFHQGHSFDSCNSTASERGHQISVSLDDGDEASDLVIVSEQDAFAERGTARSKDSLQAEVKALLAITQSLRMSLSLDQVLPQILESLFAIFPTAERGFIVLRDTEGRITPRWVKLREGDPGEKIRISRTIVNRVMESQQAILSADAADDSRFRNSRSVEFAAIHSMMCAPLIDSDGNSYGVLQVDTICDRDCFRKDDLDVLISTATQASIAISNARLHEEALLRRAVQRDLELANRIQRQFLPAQPPQIAEYEFFDYYQAASQVGGDFYDYILLPDGRIAVIVADVSGHGLAAAMVTARLKAELPYCLLTAPGPAEAVLLLNTRLMQGLEEHFVTLVLAELSPRTGEVMIVNAGHLPPLLRRSDARVSEIGKEYSGFPLGIVGGTSYEQHSIQVPPGGLLLIYSDGISEAMNEAEEVYGVHRIRKHLETLTGSPRRVGQHIIDDVAQFTEGCAQGDDMCLVCFGKG